MFILRIISGTRLLLPEKYIYTIKKSAVSSKSGEQITVIGIVRVTSWSNRIIALV